MYIEKGSIDNSIDHYVGQWLLTYGHWAMRTRAVDLWTLTKKVLATQ
jgi:hypothetical protein